MHFEREFLNFYLVPKKIKLKFVPIFKNIYLRNNYIPVKEGEDL